MAAAEYYGDGRSQAPRPQQQYLSPLPYPLSDAPPPYTSYMNQRPLSQSQSQPPPHTRPHPDYSPNSGYQYPSPPNQNANINTHQYPPEKQVHFGQPGRPVPNGGVPAVQQSGRGSRRRTSTAKYDSSGSPYRDEHRDDSKTRSPSRSRSRDIEKPHHHHHHHRIDNNERPQQKRKGSGVSTFLGAGGGAVIGDLIFPGLGTIGGALLGGLSGHEFGRERRSYSSDRDYYEENQRRGRRRQEERR